MGKVILILVGVFLSNVAFAGGWTPVGHKISQIIIEGPDTGGVALIVIKDGVDEAYIPSECSSGYNTISLETEKGRSMLALALAAKLADKSVRLALNSCAGKRPLISHLMLID